MDITTKQYTFSFRKLCHVNISSSMLNRCPCILYVRNIHNTPRQPGCSWQRFRVGAYMDHRDDFHHYQIFDAWQLWQTRPNKPKWQTKPNKTFRLTMFLFILVTQGSGKVWWRFRVLIIHGFVAIWNYNIR